ncbi:MAG TPA: class I SAM-dependent methyltransferase [Solirubrobacterales bacterium]|nr:class I SAM-dependent methyltransferase [Solirubrobacterales bacterium]
MEQGTTTEIPSDWYRRAFPAEETTRRPWADRTEAEVDRALGMLAASGSERVLDLACGTGRHALELARRGFEVVGIDIARDLLDVAESDAASESLEATFVEADLRELDYEDEFDLVLSLNDGAVGYFETEEENRRTFEVVARALRSGGGHLMQLPNVLYAETHLPQKTWIEGGSMIELIDHRWNASSRYLEGTTTPIHFGDVFEGVSPIPFRQRLYSLDELAEIYESVGMSLANAFRGNGKPRPPKDTQFELFVEGRKA